MLGLIVVNLVRNRGRTVLTALGVGIGVATIVAMLSLSEGLKQSVGGLSHLGGASFGLFQEGVADPTVSVLPDSLSHRVAAQPGVSAVAPIRLVSDALPEAPSAIVFGAPRSSFAFRRLVVVSGNRPGPGEAMVGDALARDQGLRPGGEVRLRGVRFQISGVFHAGVSFEDGGIVVSPAAATSLAGDVTGVTTIAVMVSSRTSAETVADRLRAAFPGTMTIANPGEAARSNPSFEIVSKAVLVIAALALLIGAVSVTNTMAMAVLERQREIALLAAIGWSRAQVGGMILGEGLAVGLAGAGLGVFLAVAIGHGVVSLVSATGFVSPILTAWTVLRALLVGLAIGVVGGLYPAWRVTRIPPATVLGRV